MSVETAEDQEDKHYIDQVVWSEFCHLCRSRFVDKKLSMWRYCVQCRRGLGSGEQRFAKIDASLFENFND
jgi:hypothetical protein